MSLLFSKGDRAELGEARKCRGPSSLFREAQAWCLAATPLFETPWQDLGESLTHVGSQSSQPFLG